MTSIKRSGPALGKGKLEGGESTESFESIQNSILDEVSAILQDFADALIASVEEVYGISFHDLNDSIQNIRDAAKEIRFLSRNPLPMPRKPQPMATEEFPQILGSTWFHTGFD